MYFEKERTLESKHLIPSFLKSKVVPLSGVAGFTQNAYYSSSVNFVELFAKSSGYFALATRSQIAFLKKYKGSQAIAKVSYNFSVHF